MPVPRDGTNNGRRLRARSIVFKSQSLDATRHENAPDLLSSAPVESPLFTRVVIAAVVYLQSILS